MQEGEFTNNINASISLIVAKQSIMRNFSKIIFLLLHFINTYSCKKDRHICSEEKILKRKCEANTSSSTYFSAGMKIDTVYIFGDSICLIMKTYQDYDCDYLVYCHKEEGKYQPSDSTHPYPVVFFTPVIKTTYETKTTFTGKFYYNISFLKQEFAEDSIGIYLEKYSGEEINVPAKLLFLKK